MDVTPLKSCKRKMKEESPSTVFDSFEDTDADVTYEFLTTKTKTNKKDGVQLCKVPLGQRPQKFVKSPNVHVRNRQLIPREPKLPDKSAECENIFKSILNRKEVEKENEDDCSNYNNSTLNQDHSSVIKDVNRLLDDSSSDLMYQVSQQVEDDGEGNSYSKVNDDDNADYVKPFKSNLCEQSLSTSKEESLDSAQLLKYNRTSGYSEKMLKKSQLCKNKIFKQSTNGTYGDNCVKTVTRSNFSLCSETNISSLLEDGNDAGFVELDERSLNCVNLSSSISFTQNQKCTPQEIEAKRREALKKLQQKKINARQSSLRHKIIFK